MLRIIVSALLLILGGPSFTSSPAQAQGPTTPFGPGTSTEALPWCSGLSLTPYCPVGIPACTKPIPCSYFDQRASMCGEWRCISLAGSRRR
jgi:hypothetical protein